MDREIKYIKECIKYALLIRESSFYLDETVGSRFYKIDEEKSEDEIFSTVYEATKHLKNIELRNIRNISRENNEKKIIEIVFSYKDSLYAVEV